MQEVAIDKYLDIKVYPEKTIIKYYNDGNIYFVYQSEIGIDKMTEKLVSEIILSDWLSGIIYTLDHISLIERVPIKIYLSSPKYSSLLEKFLRNENTYSQFYIESGEFGKEIRVIIKDVNHTNLNSNLEDSQFDEQFKNEETLEKLKPYERYTKTISQFKI